MAMFFLRLWFLAGVAAATWGVGIRPEGEDPELDCGLRAFALDFAEDISSLDRKVVADALQYSTLCGDDDDDDARVAFDRKKGSVVARKGSVVGRATTRAADYDCVVEVEAGDDLVAAVSKSRESCAEGLTKAVLLEEGTYYVKETLRLDERDRGLTIASLDSDKKATISGGVPLRDLEWEPSDDSESTTLTARVDDESSTAFAGSAWSLWVNGRREIRARVPNGDPETQGLHTSPSGWFDDQDAWSDPREEESGGEDVEEIKVDDVRDTPYFRDFRTYVGVERYDPPYSFWGTTTRPTKLDLSNLTASDEVVVHAFHGAGWGGWQFRVADVDSDVDSRNVATLTGGQQEARGNDDGGPYYLENSLAYLDAEREFYFDHSEHRLHYKPRANESDAFFFFKSETTTAKSGPADVVASSLAELVRVEDGADGISLLNLIFTQTRPTYLEEYRVPSGGDWSIHASAAVVAMNCHDLRVQDCAFTSLGGNALLLEASVNRTTVKRTDFHNLGASGVVLLGHTRYDDDYDSVDGDPALMEAPSAASSSSSYPPPPLMEATRVPRNTTIEESTFRDIGIYEKQTSGVVQFLSARTTISESIFFNGPRAAITFNDGFHGGHTIRRCLLFNFVRETKDHGNFNSWDRQPYASSTDVDAQSSSELPSTIEKSFVFNNYHSEWPLDHDDGSAYFVDSDNVVLWGGVKNYKGYRKTTKDSLYVNVDLGAQGDRGCAMDDSEGALDVYTKNVCITTAAGNKLVSSKVCDPTDLNATMPLASANAYYAPDASLRVPCGDDDWSFADYQSRGMDAGSTLKELPSKDDILSWVRAKLELEPSIE
mmetsp:Transcript_13494/g.43960  ORF Transcript_13494/g.43960 Transcript_13494/m.43960 type:complete len:829 (-) Transcript_13494:128-2614(-)